MGGSNSTHVANGCGEPIYAKVSHERIEPTVQEGNIPDSFVKISPNEFFRFDVNWDNLRSSSVQLGLLSFFQAQLLQVESGLLLCEGRQ